VRVLITSTAGVGHTGCRSPVPDGAAGESVRCGQSRRVVGAVAPEALGIVDRLGIQATPAGLDRAAVSSRAPVGWPEVTAGFGDSVAGGALPNVGDPPTPLTANSLTLSWSRIVVAMAGVAGPRSQIQTTGEEKLVSS
jgi:hypothetical protein